MRFEVSRVLDSIERRLTTDVTLAQAVVDLGEVARFAELDGGRPANLIRVGMAVDALSRYLIDAGAMLYAVADRELMSEPGLTSKERMVLGRWADDGLIEVTSAVAGRAVEIADLTGLPLLARRPYAEFAERFPWLRENPERILRLIPRAGSAVLSPADGTEVDAEVARAVAVGTAAVADGTAANQIALPEVFATRGVQRISHTMVVRRRFVRAAPSDRGAALLAREWRCAHDACPAFGADRQIGQPLPRLRQDVPACPRHASPLRDVGARPPAYAISVVVDDLARRRFVVRADRPVSVGAAESDDPDLVSVAEWAHQAAKAWIGPVHVRLEVGDDGALLVTDVSRTGTVIWRRSGPEDTGRTMWLRGSSAPLGDWDSVEVYTGFELVRGDRRLATVVGRTEPLSVLLDAPTVAVPQLS